MNHAFLIGNVGKEPEIKNTQNSKLASFSVATTDGYKDNKKTNWHTVKAWGKLAEIIEKYVKKGDKIAIVGQIEYSEYEGKYYTNITASSIELIGGKPQIGEDSAQINDWKADKPAESTQPEPIETDDDLPF